jgi:heat shock protein HslJ
VTTIHTQFLRKDQIPKFVEYKVPPSFYTLHTFYFAEAHIANRGKAEAMYISPMRDAIGARLRPTNHTDFVVAPLDQMMMLWSAVNRTSRTGAEIGSDQRVTPYEGLKAMTAWAAEQYGEQDTKGTLEVGKLADLVILEKDPLTVDRNAIREIKVLETIKEGVTIYPAPAGRDDNVAASVLERKGVYTWRPHACDKVGVNAAAHRVWTLSTLNGEKISAPKPPTMQFSHGRLAVFGGVNRLTGSYALIEDRVVMGDLVSTKMAGDPALMELERKFAKTLASVDAFSVSGDALTLLSKGEATATFTASPAEKAN